MAEMEGKDWYPNTDFGADDQAQPARRKSEPSGEGSSMYPRMDAEERIRAEGRRRGDHYPMTEFEAEQPEALESAAEKELARRAEYRRWYPKSAEELERGYGGPTVRPPKDGRQGRDRNGAAQTALLSYLKKNPGVSMESRAKETARIAEDFGVDVSTVVDVLRGGK